MRGGDDARCRELHPCEVRGGVVIAGAPPASGAPISPLDCHTTDGTRTSTTRPPTPTPGCALTTRVRVNVGASTLSSAQPHQHVLSSRGIAVESTRHSTLYAPIPAAPVTRPHLAVGCADLHAPLPAWASTSQCILSLYHGTQHVDSSRPLLRNVAADLLDVVARSCGYPSGGSGRLAHLHPLH